MEENKFVTVTTNDKGECILVSWQDDDHRILSVIWEAPEKPADLVNARLVEALKNTIDLLWVEDSHSVEFDGTVKFGQYYDFSGVDGTSRTEFLWPGFDCIVWPSAGRKWSAYCTHEGSMWFEKFDTKGQAKEQCFRLLEQVIPEHPVSKARAALALAAAQQAEPVRLTDRELISSACTFRAIETAVLRKNGFKVED